MPIRTKNHSVIKEPLLVLLPSLDITATRRSPGKPTASTLAEPCWFSAQSSFAQRPPVQLLCSFSGSDGGKFYFKTMLHHMMRYCNFTSRPTPSAMARPLESGRAALTASPYITWASPRKTREFLKTRKAQPCPERSLPSWVLQVPADAVKPLC